MRPGPVVTLPVANPVYDATNEQAMRRSVEQGMELLNSEVVSSRDKTNKNASLAVRRFQFLLMGAPGG